MKRNEFVLLLVTMFSYVGMDVFSMHIGYEDKPEMFIVARFIFALVNLISTTMCLFIASKSESHVTKAHVLQVIFIFAVSAIAWYVLASIFPESESLKQPRPSSYPLFPMSHW